MPGHIVYQRKDENVAASPRAKHLPHALSERLKQLAQLPQNWDSYGAPPISPRTIEQASSVLREILAIDAAKDVPLPFIAPAGDGTIVMEWTTPWEKELIISVHPDDEPATFLLVEPTTSGGECEMEGIIGEKFGLFGLIQRFSSRQ